MITRVRFFSLSTSGAAHYEVGDPLPQYPGREYTLAQVREIATAPA